MRKMRSKSVVTIDLMKPRESLDRVRSFRCRLELLRKMRVKRERIVAFMLSIKE